MKTMNAEVVEFLQASTAFERAIGEVGTALKEMERLRLEWEPLMGTPKGSELASAFGVASRRAGEAQERCDIVKQRWEAARARVSVVQVVDAVQQAEPHGNA